MSGVLITIVVALLIWAVFLYNRLVKDRNRVRSAWSDIDVQLTRRHELVPLIVEAVKAYAGHERSTLEAVTALRTNAAAAERLADKAGFEGELEAGLKKLIVLAEAYPDLKSNENFLDLQNQLVEVEDHLQYSRRYYNGAVRILNTRIETIPDVLVARSFGFHPAEFFEAGSREAPKVSL